jgi:ribosome biogenesis protein Tsr3
VKVLSREDEEMKRERGIGLRKLSWRKSRIFEKMRRLLVVKRTIILIGPFIGFG